MEIKPWIWKTGRFISLPFIVIAAVVMIAWFCLINFWLSVQAAYLGITALYAGDLRKKEAHDGT